MSNVGKWWAKKQEEAIKGDDALTLINHLSEPSISYRLELKYDEERREASAGLHVIF